MAITGYFIDKDWNYCEILLGFEPLHGSHTGAHLSETVVQILTGHGIADRVLSITTDNASNNNTMIIGVQEAVQAQALSDASIFRIPCIAHVIQLCLNQLLGKLKAAPENKEAESDWSNERTQSLHPRRPTQQITDTLKKVSVYLILSLYLTLANNIIRFEASLSLSMQARSVGKLFLRFKPKSQSLSLSKMFAPAGIPHS
jgi:hypothetical protein